MSTRQSRILNMLKVTENVNESYNIKHVEFVRKQGLQKNKKKNLFSNSLPRKTMPSKNDCLQAVNLKLQNKYAPKNISKPMSYIHKKIEKLNPYKRAIEESKELQSIIQNSLQKSFKITKKSFTLSKSDLFTNQVVKMFKRPKTSSMVIIRKSSFQVNSLSHSKIVNHNPQLGEISKNSSNSLIQKPRYERRKALSELSDYLGCKQSQKSKIINQV